MKHYVLGFLFNEPRDRVVLIEKQRPDWQKGRWNGVGGKVEQEEEDEWGPAAPTKAMIREFEEEAGVKTGFHDWSPFAVLAGKEWTVFVYRCFSSLYCSQVTSKTDELLGEFPVNKLSDVNTISNLQWLVPLALNIDRGIKTPITFEYDH